MQKYIKRQVKLLLTAEWSSHLANHRDEYFCNINVWRECELFPKELWSFIKDGERGDEVVLTFSQGQLFSCNQNKIYKCKPWQFSPPDGLKHLSLRKGRFYPLGFFRDIPGIYSGNPYPGRIINLDPSGNFTLDANHPLCGYELKIKAKVLKITEKFSELGGRCKDYWEMFLNGPGMQARYKGEPTDFGIDEPYTFSREDETEDSIFYAEPRLIGHIDRVCHQNLVRFYSEKLPAKGKFLDLMSSYESHLPEGEYEIWGLGINLKELEANPRLDHRIVKDINLDPNLPFPDEFFDVVVCDLSIEYVTKPLALISEVKRVLRKGGKVFFSFSNRYFPTKVIKGWIELHEFERMGFVLELLARIEGMGKFGTYSLRGFPRPIDDKWSSLTRVSDPLYVVFGERID
uniref:Methyltransferase domain-containing protein n=1 Tax=Thermodesulfobacterium geofontis TaxID=1295609 RepID=A0A7V6CE21_9BACT